MDRKKLLAIIHIEKSKRGLNEEEYQAAVGSVAKGKSSAADLSDQQLSLLANLLQGKKTAGMISSKQQWLIRELWKQKSNEQTEAALNRWLEHHWGVSALRFVDKRKASNIIAALQKKW